MLTKLIILRTRLLLPLALIGLSPITMAITDVEGTASDKPIPSQAPEKALLSTIRFPEEMKATVFAKQPDVQDPTAICFDEQNRLYITETHRFERGIEDNRRNPHWVRDDIALTTPQDRLEMYRKHANVKPLDYYTKYSEVIRCLEDKDNDGHSDRAWIYADGFNDPLDGTAAGIMAAYGKVYFACIPHVWELRDTDGDGKADQRKSLQSGYGISTSLSGHDLNGFAWGPDGRIYFTIGDRGYNLKTADGRHLYDQYGGAIFRMEPDGSDLQVIHEGLRNPKEIAFDQYGNAFSVDNNADMGDKARVVYMVEGAHSGWTRGHQNFNNFRNAIDVSGRHWQSWMKEHIWEQSGENRPHAYLPAVGYVSTGPSGLAYNPGTGLDAKWNNHFFVCDFRGGESSVIAFEMQSNGAGWAVKQQQDFIKGFLNTDIDFGYDGKVYVSDYTGSWTTHGEGTIFCFYNPQEIAKPECAQIRGLFAKGFDTLKPVVLESLLGHPDQRVRLRAQFELAKNPSNRDRFLQATGSQNPLLTRLHGVWGLGQLARTHKDQASVAALATLASDSETRIRGQVVQILGEVAPVEAHAAIASLLKDENLNTRMLAAIALGKAGDTRDIAALIALIEDNNDRDAYLRHGAIRGLESIARISGNTSALFSHASSQSIAVRRALVITLRQLKAVEVAYFLNDPEPTIAIEAIQAINDAYIEDARPYLAKATQWIGKSTTPIDNRIINAIFRCGGDENLQRLLDLARNQSLPADARAECLFALRRWQNPPPVDPTTGKHRPLPTDRSLAKLQQAIANTLNQLLASTKDKLLAEVIETIDSLGIDADKPTMLGHFGNPRNPSPIRLAALHLLVPQKDQELITALQKTLSDSNRDVRTASFAALAKLEPDLAVEAIPGILSKGSAFDRQQLFAVLGPMNHPQAAATIVQSLERLTQMDPAVQLDIIEAAEQRKEPEIAAALASYRAGLDTNDPLAAFRVSLEGGDVNQGRSVFYGHGAAECSRCHMALKNRKGGNAGPHLGNVGTLHPPEYLLESIVNPNARTAPGYGIISITLKDGSMVAGKLMDENEQAVMIADMTGANTKTYPRTDIVSSTRPMSTMPPMGMILNKREIRDVIAFLKTLKTKP